MPRKVEINETKDCLGKTIYRHNTVVFANYCDSKPRLGTIVNITQGTENNQVYIQVPERNYDWRKKEWKDIKVCRKPAKNVLVYYV